jgi:hypothetical protein
MRLVYVVIAFIGIVGMQAPANAGGFDPDEDSPDNAVAQRRFPILA